MTAKARLVLDANILLRSVLGTRVRHLLQQYGSAISFYTPDVCFSEAAKWVPAISSRRHLDVASGLSHLDSLTRVVESVGLKAYEVHEAEARLRIGYRDIDDWPVVATALLLDCPIWTEDHDFFGTGIPIWTTQTVELYLRPH